MTVHIEWSEELSADIVIGASGRRHCECGELPDDIRMGKDPMVDLCYGCFAREECEEEFNLEEA